MEPTLKELKEMYESQLNFTKGIREDLDKVIGETGALNLENAKLSLRKRETFDAVWELAAQYNDFEEVCKTFRLVKQEKIASMREKIDELKMTIAMKQQKLENLIRGDYGPDFEIKPRYHCNPGYGIDDEGQVKLVYHKIMNNVNPPKRDQISVESETMVDAGVVPLEDTSNPNASGDGGNGGATAFIRDFGHLYQLKAYLTDERNTKKVANSLTKTHKKAFKAALLRFLENILEDLTKPFEDFSAGMSMTMQQFLDRFELCLDCELKSRSKISIIQRFQYLLTKFGKKYPAEVSPKKCGFFNKLFGRSEKAARVEVETERREQLKMAIAAEMLLIETLRGEDLQKDLTVAKAQNQFAATLKLQYQNDISLLSSVMEETNLQMQAFAICFHEACKNQDAEITELKMTILQLETKIELNDFCTRYIFNGMKIREEDNFVNETSKSSQGSGNEFNFYICDVEL